MKKRSEGWHSDYTQKHELRYYDGSTWTEHVSDQGVQGVDPLPFVPKAAAEVAPAETRAAAPVEAPASGTTSKMGKMGKVLAGPAYAAVKHHNKQSPPEWTPAETEAPAAAASSSGGGGWGDGVTRPLYEFQASRLKGGRMITPNVIRVWADRVEEYQHHALRKKDTNSIHFARVAQVTIKRGLVWTDVGVESTGGHTITLIGIPKDEAEKVKTLLDDAVNQATSPQQVVVQAAAAVKDVATQLRELAALRDEGILTAEEFEIQKARVLSS